VLLPVLIRGHDPENGTGFRKNISPIIEELPHPSARTWAMAVSDAPPSAPLAEAVVVLSFAFFGFFLFGESATLPA